MAIAVYEVSVAKIYFFEKRFELYHSNPKAKCKDYQ